jgi:GNAT superfamily N-acetyltransferase
MDYAVLGWHADGPTLRLDHERFRYAGKFVMSNTGKAVVRDGDELVAAAAFNEDRTDESTLWIRYVTVRDDQRGDGIGPRLAAFITERARDAGYGAVKIAVNNPFAYVALYRAGFEYTGEETGLAELVLQWPPSNERSTDAYQEGLGIYATRDFEPAVQDFISEKRANPLPDRVDPPDSGSGGT